MDKMFFKKSTGLVLLLSFFACQILLAVSPSIEAISHLDSKKKLKIKLKDGSTFKAFVVKQENKMLYTVSTKKERLQAKENDCSNCKMTATSQIEKIKPIKKTAKIMAICFGLFAVFLLIAAVGLTSSAELNGNDSFGDVLFTPDNGFAALVLLCIGLLIGYGIGSAIDSI